MNMRTGKVIRVILQDGTEHTGRLRMIVNAPGPKARPRKIICLEIAHSGNIVRIEESSIRAVMQAELAMC
jgi:hypothetical protein